MGGVDSHEAASVCAGLFDGDLACRRAHGDKLICYDFRIWDDFSVHGNRILFLINYGVLNDLALRADGDRLHKGNSFRRLQVLDDAAANQAQRNDEIQGDQNVNDDPRHIYPKAAKACGFHFDKTAYHRKEYGDASCSGNKVLYGKA